MGSVFTLAAIATIVLAAIAIAELAHKVWRKMRGKQKDDHR